MSEIKVYIGYLYGKGLFHTYSQNIENGFDIIIDKNLATLIRRVTEAANFVENKPVPKTCRWKSFII